MTNIKNARPKTYRKRLKSGYRNLVRKARGKLMGFRPQES